MPTLTLTEQPAGTDLVSPEVADERALLLDLIHGISSETSPLNGVDFAVRTAVLRRCNIVAPDAQDGCTPSLALRETAKIGRLYLRALRRARNDHATVIWLSQQFSRPHPSMASVLEYLYEAERVLSGLVGDCNAITDEAGERLPRLPGGAANSWVLEKLLAGLMEETTSKLTALDQCLKTGDMVKIALHAGELKQNAARVPIEGLRRAAANLERAANAAAVYQLQACLSKGSWSVWAEKVSGADFLAAGRGRSSTVLPPPDRAAQMSRVRTCLLQLKDERQRFVRFCTVISR